MDEEGIRIYSISECERAYEHSHILCIASLGEEWNRRSVRTISQGWTSFIMRNEQYSLGWNEAIQQRAQLLFREQGCALVASTYVQPRLHPADLV